MANKIVMVDTNILIDYFRKKDKSKTLLVNLSEKFEQVYISSITEFEIYCGAPANQLSFWNELLKSIVPVPFDGNCVQTVSKIYSDLKVVRKSIEIADLFIAATSISNQLPFCTLNKKHSENIVGIELVDD